MAAKKGNETPTVSAASLVNSTQCSAQGCTKKTERLGFCGGHFRWFKLGLLTRSGERAKDFDRKVQHFPDIAAN